MNSLNPSGNSLNSNEKYSPVPEMSNQQNADGKNWSKTPAAKEAECLRLEGSVSPKLESLVEVMPTSPPPPQRPASFKQNGPPNKRTKLEEDEYDSIEMACHLASEISDDCDAFGKSVAAQLRQMNRMQKFIAQRLISEVCFRGQIQNLQMTTGFVNQPPSYQHQGTAQHGSMGPTRPSHLNSTFGRGPDYILVHQPTVRHPSHLSGPASQQYQNFVHLQQPQLEHSSTSLTHSSPSLTHLEPYGGN